jgi:hypothetical protein
MKIWWAINIVWLFIFGALAVFISIRTIDGAGAVQTPEIKMITLGILGIAFIFVLLIQLLFLYFVRKSTKNKTKIKSA